jgi:hypothetical protein
LTYTAELIFQAASMSTDPLIQTALTTLALQVESVAALKPRINADFANACRLILASKGRVIVMGMGKSGHIGNTGEHRHAVLLRASGRSEPWGHRHGDA